MKVALFTHVCYPFTNGVATSVEQLAKQLKLRGHDVTIVSNNYDSFSNAIVGDNIRVTSFPIFYQNLRIPLLVNPELFKYLSESIETPFSISPSVTLSISHIWDSLSKLICIFPVSILLK